MLPYFRVFYHSQWGMLHLRHAYLNLLSPYFSNLILFLFSYDCCSFTTTFRMSSYSSNSFGIGLES